MPSKKKKRQKRNKKKMHKIKPKRIPWDDIDKLTKTYEAREKYVPFLITALLLVPFIF